LCGGKDALGFRPPGGDGPFFFGRLPEDEPQQHVKAADGEEKESGDEREIVDVVREDLGRDTV
jgi:hypothetical protein